jgi:hypothetical protein
VNKKAPLLLWLVAAILLYVASSGPALLLTGTGAGAEKILAVVYWPLSKIVVFPPATKLLAPYWNFFIEPDANPLYPG